jgi:PEP-CTERM motif
MFRTVLAVLTFSAIASASVITIATPGGSTESGGNPVSASAMFTTSAGQVTIDLSNLLAIDQFSTVAQALSDLSFTLSGTFATGLVDDTNRTYTAQLINVGTGGAVTLTSGTFNGWDFSNIGSTFLLEDLGSIAGPAQTMLGGTPGSLSPYCGANTCGSIINNGPHNPFIQGTAHFVLNVAGVTSATTVTGATFSFGTALGNNVPGGNVPEPISSALVGSGLVGLFFLGRRRATRKA